MESRLAAQAERESAKPARLYSDEYHEALEKMIEKKIERGGKPAPAPAKKNRPRTSSGAADTSFATIFGNAILTEMQLSNEIVTTESQPPQYVDGPISNCPN